MINKAFIYPYSRSFAAYLRHIKHFNIFNIVAAVTPGKWANDNYDVGYIDDGENIGIPISLDYDHCLNECDTVIWANYDYYSNNDFYKTVLLRIKKAMAAGKNIVCFEQLSSEEENDLQNYAETNNIMFIYKPNNSPFDCYSDLPDEIDVPIISVLGMTENCSKFDTELSIYRLLSDKGYKVSLISSKSNADLLGVQSFPSFMYSNNYNEIEKINLYSNFVKSIARHQQPDVILLGIPGGLIPFNKIHNMHYGITAYEIFSIIKPDYNIVNIWADYLSNTVIDDLINICKYRHGIKIDAIGISNISIFNDHSTIDREHQEYNIYNLQWVDDKIASYGFEHRSGLKLYNIKKNTSMEKLVNDVIDTLSE